MKTMAHPYTEALRKNLAIQLQGYGKKAKLAAAAGITREHLSTFVNGEAGITLDVAGRISDALGKKLPELLVLPPGKKTVK